MAGHSILYLGRTDFAPDFIADLKASDVCSRFSESESLDVPGDDADSIDLVLFEAGPGIAKAGKTLPELVHSLSAWPVIALTRHDQEHRSESCLRGRYRRRCTTGRVRSRGEAPSPARAPVGCRQHRVVDPQ